MEKIVLKNGTEIPILSGSTLSHIVTMIDYFSDLEDLKDELSFENLKEVKFCIDDVINGIYENMVLLEPHFKITEKNKGIEVIFGIREKTTEEQQKENVQTALSYLTDEQAITVPTLYPEWSSKKSYEAGDRCQYEEGLYKCLQNHAAQVDWNPDAASSLWAPLLILESDVILEWIQPDSTNGYVAGDVVLHNDRLWESTVDDNVWEPGIVGTESLWKDVTDI